MNAIYNEKNKEHRKALHTAYYEKNKEWFAAYRIAYRGKNREKLLAKGVAYYKEHKEHARAHQIETRQRLRNQFYDRYGLPMEGHEHGVCSCPGCGADLVEFGTISHIDGSGGEHRKLLNGGIFTMLKEAIAHYDPARFAAECFNCNCAAARNGGVCPHKTIGKNTDTKP